MTNLTPIVTWTDGSTENMTTVYRLEFYADMDTYDVIVDSPVLILDNGTPENYLLMIGCEFEVIAHDAINIMMTLSESDIIVKYADGSYIVICLN